MSAMIAEAPSKGRPMIDILMVLAASAAAFMLEGLADARGIVSVDGSVRGTSSVVVGALAVLLLVRLRGGTWRDLGFTRPARWITAPLWVLGILVAFVAGQMLLPALISRFIELPEPDMSKYGDMAGNLGAALFLALVLPVSAALPEEIIYRGFLIGRLEEMFGRTVPGTLAAVLVQSLIFGSVHFQWGLGGMVMTFIMGIIWGTSYILCGRNLWIVIAAHGLGHWLLAFQLYMGGSFA